MRRIGTAAAGDGVTLDAAVGDTHVALGTPLSGSAASLNIASPAALSAVESVSSLEQAFEPMPLVGTVDIVGVDRDDPTVRKAVDSFARHAVTPEKAAAAIVRGVEKGRYMVYTSQDIRPCTDPAVRAVRLHHHHAGHEPAGPPRSEAEGQTARRSVTSNVRADVSCWARQVSAAGAARRASTATTTWAGSAPSHHSSTRHRPGPVVSMRSRVDVARATGPEPLVNGHRRGLRDGGQHARPAQARRSHGAGEVAVEDVDRVRVVQAAVVGAVRQHDDARREPVAADVAALPHPVAMTFGQRRGDGTAANRAAGVVASVRADEQHRLVGPSRAGLRRAHRGRRAGRRRRSSVPQRIRPLSTSATAQARSGVASTRPWRRMSSVRAPASCVATSSCPRIPTSMPDDSRASNAHGPGCSMRRNRRTFSAVPVHGVAALAGGVRAQRSGGGHGASVSGGDDDAGTQESPRQVEPEDVGRDRVAGEEHLDRRGVLGVELEHAGPRGQPDAVVVRLQPGFEVTSEERASVSSASDRAARSWASGPIGVRASGCVATSRRAPPRRRRPTTR